MNFHFYGYTLRSTGESDLALALDWADPGDMPPHQALAQAGEKIWQARFWLRQGDGRESFIVVRDGEALAFFQIERPRRSQGRIHWQPSPAASPKKLLRGITKLVPLIEKALALSGVQAIFFTSRSLAMVAFMEKRLGYRLARDIDGGPDGVVMFKLVGELGEFNGFHQAGPGCGIAGQSAERGAKG